MSVVVHYAKKEAYFALNYLLKSPIESLLTNPLLTIVSFTKLKFEFEGSQFEMLL